MKLLKAKNFNIKDAEEKFFNLYKYQGSSWLLLIFFRGEWCQHCRKQLLELNNNYNWFKKRGIKIVAISADDILFTSILKEILKTKFPVISDNRWRIFGSYGFEKSVNQKKIKPALFLFNSKHQTVYSYIGRNYRDRPTIGKLKQIIKESQRLN